MKGVKLIPPGKTNFKKPSLIMVKTVKFWFDQKPLTKNVKTICRKEST